ncbi:MAG: DUF1553 domain-containing protein [Planctomycetaceae bacterium]|nr:DUF1553 domain-containing protein [Planctomycetales bacterium]MCB9922190.1 DUF1553 domain-containing protein [Planctomycetaceae bacterium]
MKLAAAYVVVLLITAAPALSSDYLRDVKPLLEHKCYACHGAFKQQANLRLDTAAGLKLGGDSGSPVSPGNPNDSLLIDVLTGEAGYRMPPANEGTPLAQEEIGLVRQWIAEGAVAPPDEQPQAEPKSWWSYQPIVRPVVPEVTERQWCRTQIDRFVAAAREREHLPHADEASKSVWLRRAFIDLIGLPPTRAELHAFLSDPSVTAYEAIVDDLLSRPQYGERWGRHWMDVWRYSDWYGSRGINEIRYSQRHIWRWRDWIISSLNDDKGYDQMICEMLAADEIAGDDATVVPATGYLGRNWYKFDRDVWLFETVERTSEAFLGLTLRCCRCHDHKFDPISQKEYYRFRAFFEPHQVRTDPITALTAMQKDATLGDVLTDGIALVYDKDTDAPTYRFERGDNRHPDKTESLTPGVPAALGGDELQILPIDLPPQAWYPILREGVRETLIEKARREVVDAEQKCREAEAKLTAVRDKLARASRVESTSSPEPQVFLHDDFAKDQPEVWRTVSGTWVYEDNKLLETAVTGFATIVSKQNHPRDFKVRLRYRPLEPGSYRSIGLSFDYQDQGNSQDVYTSTNDKRQSVQAFHRVGGKQLYPQAGIVYTELKVGEEALLEVEVRGSRLTIHLNGERKLDYDLPVARQDGKFALWVHQGSAEFLELTIAEDVESVETLQQRVNDAERALALAKAEIELARVRHESVKSRVAASMAVHLGKDTDRAEELAFQASRAEQQVAIAEAEIELARVKDNAVPDTSDNKIADAEAKLAAARKATETISNTFTPLGIQYPKTSTGRRAALAEWIANAANPRTARVAVNHLWGRHFGQPLVASPENFGLNGRRPTHPELLDWLATELIANHWNMKPLHRQIVLSSTYRASSQATGLESALAKDPDNKFLWRMNPRRMEAEVVRDSTLYLANDLNLQLGGPEIPETEGEIVQRRSMYFRNTPNEKMPLLEVFDVADPNSCYRRKDSVVPHQSLAMMNSGLTTDRARIIAGQLHARDNDFIAAAFETILSRSPTEMEARRCQEFLERQAEGFGGEIVESFAAGGTAKRPPSNNSQLRARENLVHVLLLHNDFVTVR